MNRRRRTATSRRDLIRDAVFSVAFAVLVVMVANPVGAGLVDSLARPGGNATGFMAFEYGMSGKWLELLKEIAPTVTRAAIVRDLAIAAGLGQFGAIQLTPTRYRSSSQSNSNMF